MVSACMQHFCPQKKVSEQQFDTGIYRVPDLSQFVRVQIIDVSEPGLVHFFD